VKIAVAGKGGAGKTTVSGTIARALARAGHRVVALDADTNPMLGISLGVGPDETERLVAVRQALDAGEVAHEPTTEGLVATFGTDAPDDIRLVVASRIDDPEPSCPCCGVSPEQLLDELEGHETTVICDMEAGLGTLRRVSPGQLDVVLVVVNPTAKSIDAAARAVEIAEPKAEVVVVANRVTGHADLETIRHGLGERELVVIPEDPAIALADRDGVAPLDVAAHAPGVRVMVDLAERLAGEAVPA
jgi:CO dehydrogenase maturation factor